MTSMVQLDAELWGQAKVSDDQREVTLMAPDNSAYTWLYRARLTASGGELLIFLGQDQQPALRWRVGSAKATLVIPSFGTVVASPNGLELRDPKGRVRMRAEPHNKQPKGVWVPLLDKDTVAFDLRFFNPYGEPAHQAPVLQP